MFQIGDKIVYPMHGAGVVEAIEEKEILGETRTYYIIHMPINDMQIMIPTGKASAVRYVVDGGTLEDVLFQFEHGESDQSVPWKQRHRMNMEKIKTGAIYEGAEVVRDLMRQHKGKPLNASEKQLLDTARKIFVSELALIKGLTERQATDLLESKVS
ncbi:transcription factor YdeB [Ectobacillus sp. JY-23]|uniref:CarD family transcriptional regulator n=1 Tax=Ectobacillus sp. JY-23 TaxID=2933872 RepID=UPI001FF18632|nr:CarD family transcriptional regulator [Ectobacillus sp. JY-23]UOY93570.1 transcription factor YdeB [Ectobacillus sp. JY-23]